MGRTLDLGCGVNMRGIDGWERWGIELVSSSAPNVLRADLTWEPLPFPENHFNRVFAYDFLEHLPMRAYLGEAGGSGPST